MDFAFAVLAMVFGLQMWLLLVMAPARAELPRMLFPGKAGLRDEK